jgi:hypothetical protein
MTMLLPRPLTCATALAAATLLGACASTKLDASWTNPEFAGTKLRDQTVLVACQARDFTTQAVCEDQVAAQLATRGARPVKFLVGNTGTPPTNEAIEAAAKRANARAVFCRPSAPVRPSASASAVAAIAAALPVASRCRSAAQR